MKKTSVCSAYASFALSPALASSQFEGNWIHSAPISILCMDEGEGFFRRNVIGGETGVSINASANPTLQLNWMYDCTEQAVHVAKWGAGIVKGNDIFQNGKQGVLVTDFGNPTVSGNRIFDQVCPRGCGGVKI